MCAGRMAVVTLLNRVNKVCVLNKHTLHKSINHMFLFLQEQCAGQDLSQNRDASNETSELTLLFGTPKPNSFATPNGQS